MKKIAALALAAALTAGTMSTASAFGIYPTDPAAWSAEEPLHVGPDGTVYDHCHGKASGTAHALCGTATGGPAGGLF